MENSYTTKNDVLELQKTAISGLNKYIKWLEERAEKEKRELKEVIVRISNQNR